MASLFSDLSHEAVTSVLPALLASMGVAAGALGTIEGVADGLSSVAKLYGGWWTDRLHRRKPLCAAGYGTMAIATGIIAAATTWPVVLVGRGVAWISRGLRTPARKALLAEAVTPQTYGRAFGFERTMGTLGAVIAPLAALALLRIGISQRGVLWFSVLPAFLAVAAILFLVRETAGRTPSPHPFVASLRGLPERFTRFLYGVGLFGAGDFAHSLMILYAVASLTPKFGAVRAATISVGLYALHNIMYAAISYPAGVLAEVQQTCSAGTRVHDRCGDCTDAGTEHHQHSSADSGVYPRRRLCRNGRDSGGFARCGTAARRCSWNRFRNHGSC